MSGLWQSMEKIQSPPYHLGPEDLETCYYAHEYISGGGYSASSFNSSINNLKKDPSLRTQSPQQWKYKQVAIRDFARDLIKLLNTEMDYSIAAIPSSVSRGDANYDQRIDDVLDIVANQCPNITVVRPIIRRRTVTKAHQTTNRPTPTTALRSLQWVGPELEHEHLVFVDDVITSGSIFKACKTLTLMNEDVDVWGFFWGKTVWE